MTRVTILLAAGAATLAVAVPAAAQTPYPYPQQGYPQQGYPQPGYPQGQYYPPQQGQNVIGQMIGQLLGNRYQANDRLAVERCATAAVNQASAQYGNRYRQGNGYQNQGYGYGNQGYHPQMAMRVTAITQVERRGQSGLRVSGLLDSQGGYHAYGQQPYGSPYGYQGQRHAAQGDLTFRCNVDYRGAVTSLRVRPNQTAYNRGY
ncbi:MAG: hypothetical protein M3Q19_08555 [Pseudomonadota bacterium]|nr:hypothetical protein [Pseudomonadota bacterium]